jgi:tetratricopeptide (TPR) repeat protein
VSLLLLVACPGVGKLYQKAYTQYAYDNDTEKALSTLAEIIKLDTTYTPAYILQSTIYLAKGDSERAEQALRSAKEHTPPSGIVCFDLGNIYFTKPSTSALLPNIPGPSLSTPFSLRRFSTGPMRIWLSKTIRARLRIMKNI